MKYDINKILDLLPHRYPFLLVDRIEDVVLTDELVRQYLQSQKKKQQ